MTKEILIRDKNGSFKILDLDTGRIRSTEEGVVKIKGGLDDLAEEIIRKARIEITEKLKDRLKEIIILRLKDVRDTFETKSILTKEISLGGVALKEDEAEKIIEILEKKLKERQEEPKGKKEEKKERIEEKPSLEPLSRITEEVIKKTDLSLDKEMKLRLRNIVGLRIKDIRDSLETLDVLCKPKELGGLGLDKEKGEMILREIEKFIQRGIEIRRAIEEEEEKEKKDLEEVLRKREKETVEGETKEKEEKRGVEGRVEGKEVIGAEEKILKEKELKEEGTKEKNKRVAESKGGGEEIIFEKPRVVPSKKVVDVKFKPKLIGPIEELRFLNLKDFRRISKDPKVVSERIKEKIQLLEEESYEKRVEGIKAFKESDLFSLYKEIGEEILKKGKSFQEIVREREERGLETLTEEEYRVIMELSRELRF